MTVDQVLAGEQGWHVEQGDSPLVMSSIPEGSIHACVTDPPYDLLSTSRRGSGRSNEPDNPYGRHGSNGKGFMGLAWDATGVAFDPATWAEVLRVLKPGGHLLAFGGTRTSHRLVGAIEDAGFEIRDSILWLFGSGFPKSLNLHGDWEGWGTALKPAHEPCVMARKPMGGGVAKNVAEYGTGALNIDGCRVQGEPGERIDGGRVSSTSDGWDRPWKHDEEALDAARARGRAAAAKSESSGRWPSNVILDEHTAQVLDEQTGVLVSGANPTRRGSDKFRGIYGDFKGQEEAEAARGRDEGGASRFFYVAKASRSERNAGLGDEFEERQMLWTSGQKRPGTFQSDETNRSAKNHHPTVKPIALMRHLTRLVTPPGGIVLDPFMGSGTTGIACALEGLRFIGVDREADYIEIAHARIAHWSQLQGPADVPEAPSVTRPLPGPTLFDGEVAS